MPQQRRWICHDCHTEWVYWRQWAREGLNCPKCGSEAIQHLTFEGLFDISTPRDVLARMAVQAAEDEHRAQLVGRVEIADPPIALVGEPVRTHAAMKEDEGGASVFE